MGEPFFRDCRLCAAFAATAACALLVHIATTLAFSQEPLRPERKSIHQIESEAHRDIVIHPAKALIRPRPLPLSAVQNRTHTIFGFYPYWAPGFAELRFQDLTHLAVFSVEAAGSGELTNLRGWPNASLIQAAHDANVRVVLVCTLFDDDELDSLLGSPPARRRLIMNLVEQVVGGGADGINIDFEGVRGSQRTNLTAFMTELTKEMRPAVPQAHVSIDTPAVDWSGAFDYAALADLCDALMIMGYDYYWSGSGYAGPVAPLSGSSLWGPYSVQWTVLDYLVKVGNHRSNKLLLGVPYYGYDWPVADNLLHARTLGKATARIYSDASNQADSYGRSWDGSSATPWYSYAAQTSRQCWYEDPESLSLKYDQVYQYGLQGIGIWALTYDRGKSALWDLIERRFPSSAPPDPPEITVPSTFFDPVGLPISLRSQGSIQAVHYEVAIGTSPGGTEISDFTPVGLRQQVLLQGFSFSPGITYYLTARSVGQQGIAGLPGPSAAITIDEMPEVRRKYLPYWISNSDFYTGLALMNATSAAQAVLIRGYIAGLAVPVVASWVLKPGRQMAQLLSEDDVLGAACLGKEGWLELSYVGEGLQSMYLVGDSRVARSLDGGFLLDADSRLILPCLDGGQAFVALVNPNSGPANVKFRLYGAGGSYTSEFSLAAKSMLAKRAADLFPAAFAARMAAHVDDAAPAPGAYILVESDQPVACSSTLDRNQDSAIVPGLHRLRTWKEAAFSYVLWGEGYETEAILVNPSGESLDVVLRLFGAVVAGPVRLQLAPESEVVLKLSEAFGGLGSGLVRGSLGISVSGESGILGSVWLRSTDYRIMAALPLESPGTRVIFPQLAQGQGYWTGLSMTNANGIANHVVVEALDAEGRSLGAYEVDLAPGEQRVALLYEWIPATRGMTAGRVEIRSAAPLLTAEIFGADNLSFMTAVPGK